MELEKAGIVPAQIMTAIRNSENIIFRKRDFVSFGFTIFSIFASPFLSVPYPEPASVTAKRDRAYTRPLFANILNYVSHIIPPGVVPPPGNVPPPGLVPVITSYSIHYTKLYESLAELKPDLIATIGTQASAPAWPVIRKTDIPMIFSGVTYPVEAELIQAFSYNFV